MGKKLNLQSKISISAFAITLILGIALEFSGAEMLSSSITAEMGGVKFSAGLALLSVGLVLILTALIFIYSYQFPRTGTSGDNSLRKWFGKNWYIVLLIMLLSYFIFVYSNNHYKLENGSKYDILVDLIFIFFGFTAVIGLGIFRWISREVEDKVRYWDDRLRELEPEHYRLLAYSYDKIAFEFWEAKNYEKAIEFSETCVYNIEKLGERFSEYFNSEKLSIFNDELNRCRSNLAYYYSERNIKNKTGIALKYARETLEFGMAKDDLNLIDNYLYVTKIFANLPEDKRNWVKIYKSYKERIYSAEIRKKGPEQNEYDNYFKKLVKELSSKNELV